MCSTSVSCNPPSPVDRGNSEFTCTIGTTIHSERGGARRGRLSALDKYKTTEKSEMHIRDGWTKAVWVWTDIWTDTRQQWSHQSSHPYTALTHQRLREHDTRRPRTQTRIQMQASRSSCKTATRVATVESPIQLHQAAAFSHDFTRLPSSLMRRSAACWASRGRWIASLSRR